MSKPFWPQSSRKLVEAIHAQSLSACTRYANTHMYIYMYSNKYVHMYIPYTISALAVDILSHSNYYANYTKINGENIS